MIRLYFSLSQARWLTVLLRPVRLCVGYSGGGLWDVVVVGVRFSGHRECVHGGGGARSVCQLRLLSMMKILPDSEQPYCGSARASKNILPVHW